MNHGLMFTSPLRSLQNTDETFNQTDHSNIPLLRPQDLRASGSKFNFSYLQLLCSGSPATSDQWKLMRMGEDPPIDVWMADMSFYLHLISSHLLLQLMLLTLLIWTYIVGNDTSEVKEKSNDFIWVDPSTCCLAVYSKLNAEKVLLQQSPLALAKALKNPIEMDGLKKAHVRDGAAVVQ